ADQETVAAREDGNEEFFQHALLTDHGLAQFLANPAIAVVEPFDGGQIAVDTRPALAGLFGRRFHDHRHFVGGEPGAAAAQPAAAFGNLYDQAAVLTVHGRHRWRGLVRMNKNEAGA